MPWYNLRKSKLIRYAFFDDIGGVELHEELKK